MGADAVSNGYSRPDVRDASGARKDGGVTKNGELSMNQGRRAGWGVGVCELQGRHRLSRFGGIEESIKKSLITPNLSL